MANTITGKVYQIGMTQTIPSKNGNPFIKREIVLDTTRFDPYTGERDKFENFPMFEFSGDKCTELDKFKPGDVVTISFDLQGSYIDAKDGTKKNFTRVRGYKIEARVATHAPQPQMQAPQPQAPQPMPQQHQPSQQYQPQQVPPPPPGMDDLPFPM